MKKSLYLLRLLLLITFLSFLTLSADSTEVFVHIDDIKQTLIEQHIGSSDIDKILNGLQHTDGLVYHSGSGGKGVREFQKLLLDCGYNLIGKADGKYGSKTTAAVKKFQSENNLPATGEADLITQFSLVLVINNSNFTQKEHTYIAQAKNYAVIIWPDKAFYVGALDKSSTLSEGTYYYFSGGYYAGEYKNNLRSGNGTAYFANGDVYIGQWNNDAMHGCGTYYYGGAASAEYYAGSMANNMIHGKGTYCLDGNKTTGTWSNNTHVE